MQTLEQWLSVATDGLCESAAERVRAEIGEHYLSAIESAETADADPVDVEQRAVAALGDANAANRQYRRVLLTRSEADLLNGLRSFAPHHVIGILLLVAMAVYAIAVRTSQFNYMIATAVAGILLQAVPVPSIRAGWVVRIFRWVAVTLFYTSWASQARLSPAMTVAAIVFFAVGHAHTEYKLFVLRRKVPVDQWPRRLWA